MNKRSTTIIILILAAAFLVFGAVYAADSTATKPAPKAAAKADAKPEAKPAATAAKYEYVGDKKCKLCHKNEHDSWMTTVHAKAFDTLSAEDKKKEECVGCHTTGKDATGTLLVGVQCEACHGPGSAYKSQPIMKDVKLALANGMTMPTKEVCVKCHNEKSPNFKGFDFDKWVKNEKGMHKNFPKKAPATDEKKG